MLSEEEYRRLREDHEVAYFRAELALSDPEGYSLEEKAEIIEGMRSSTEEVERAMREDFESMPPRDEAAHVRDARILGPRREGLLEPHAARLRPPVYAPPGADPRGLIRCRPERGLIGRIGELPAAEGVDVVPQQGALVVDDHQGYQVEPDGDVRELLGVLRQPPRRRDLHALAAAGGVLLGEALVDARAGGDVDEHDRVPVPGDQVDRDPLFGGPCLVEHLVAPAVHELGGCLDGAFLNLLCHG